MFFQLLLIHLYRPFLKYTKSNTPLPSHVSPRKICTQAAAAISKLLRMYKRTFGLRQICNVVVYIAHTACTIHLLNLPDKNAQRDVVHGLKHLEEMAEGWLCARRTLRILDISANKWQVELPSEAAAVFERTHSKWGSWGSWDQATSPSSSDQSPFMNSNIPTSATSPTRLSPPPEGQLAPALHTEPSLSTPAAPIAAGTSLHNNYPDPTTSAAPASFSSMRAVYRSAGLQLQRPELAPPEPTYLRPISHTGFQFPILYPPSVSSSPHSNTWYGGVSGTPQIHPNPSPTSSPVGYDEANNLVEESQDWWSRNTVGLGMGMENWGEGWDPALRPPLQYDEHAAHNLAPVAQQQRPAPGSEQLPVQTPVDMSESVGPTIDPGNNSDTPYNGGWKLN